MDGRANILHMHQASEENSMPEISDGKKIARLMQVNLRNRNSLVVYLNPEIIEHLLTDINGGASGYLRKGLNTFSVK